MIYTGRGPVGTPKLAIVSLRVDRQVSRNEPSIDL